MGGYINRELLLKYLETSIVVSGRNDVVPLELRGVHKVVNRIKTMPTEDVVPVVRCKDCKHYKAQEKSAHWENKTKYCCRTVTLKVNDNDFCSYGERKGDNE
jgi:hypothetical protein